MRKKQLKAQNKDINRWEPETKQTRKKKIQKDKYVNNSSPWK